MKILILNWRDTRHPKSGGAEQVTMQHARGWVSRGHHVTWFTAGYNDSLPSEIVDGVTIKRKGGFLTVYAYAAVYLLFHSTKYDVIVDEIHAFPFFANFVYKTPVVAFIHEVAGEIWDYMWIPPFNWLGKFFEPIFLRIYNLRKIPFWTDAPSMVSELALFGIPSARCVAIPCPITPPKHIRLEKKEKDLTCIFISRVVKMKGIEDVISAFALIAVSYPKARLWIIGSGDSEYLRELKKFIQEKNMTDHVTFYGAVSETEKYELLGKSHVLLHASVKEGWGLVVLEAAVVGTPSVVYNVPGLKDVVKHDKTGVVVQENSPEMLASEAIALYGDPKRYERYQQSGKLWVNSLTWDRAIDESEALLKRAIKKS